MTLIHDASDDPLYLFGEIFERREYFPRGFYTPQPDHVVMDLGANIGFFALFLQSRAPGIRINCFEPAPDSFRKLQANISANRCTENINAYRYAISDSEGTQTLRKGSNSMLRALMTASDQSDDGEPVNTITLERALDLCGSGHIDLLKMDIEGGEVELASHAPAQAWSRIDRMVAEIHEKTRPGSDQAVSEALKAAGFHHVVTTWPSLADGCGILHAVR